MNIVQQFRSTVDQSIDKEASLSGANYRLKKGQHRWNK